MAVSAVLVGSGPLGLLYEHLYESVLASGISGLLLGLEIFRPETDSYLGRLARLGEVRCLLRLNRKHEARYRMNEVTEGGRDACPEKVRLLSAVIATLEKPRPRPGVVKNAGKTLERLLYDAENHGLWLRDCPEKVHQDIWLLSVLGTCALSHPEILMNKPGYSDLGEVVPAIPGMQLRHTLRGHRREIISMAWSPDGILLASGARDKTVRVWNTETGECLGTLTGYRNPVDHLAWSQDGRILASYPFVESFWIQLANSLRVELEWIKDFFRTGLLSYFKRVVPVEPFSPAASVRLWDVAEGQAIKEPIMRVRNSIVFSWVEGRLLYVSPFRDASGNTYVHMRSCVENELVQRKAMSIQLWHLENRG